MLFLNHSAIRVSIGVLACVGLMACSGFNAASTRLATVITPYKMDVVQGNFVSKEQAQELKIGMNRVQVRDILGTPLLTSIFHANRWDYVFTFKRQGAEPQARRVTVYFKNDVLEKFDADNLPTEAEFVASLDSGRRAGKVPNLVASEESLAKFAPVPKAPGAIIDPGKVLPPVSGAYPPLEPSSR
jgi:outer membrane protein assembly factor BamE